MCRNGKWGCIDTNGDLVIPCYYDDYLVFIEGLAIVKKDGDTVFIDPTGDVRHVGQWDDAQYFSEGFAAVEINGKWGFINTEY